MHFNIVLMIVCVCVLSDLSNNKIVALPNFAFANLSRLHTLYVFRF
jgi:hypothetical protein